MSFWNTCLSRIFENLKNCFFVSFYTFLAFNKFLIFFLYTVIPLSIYKGLLLVAHLGRMAMIMCRQPTRLFCIYFSNKIFVSLKITIFVGFYIYLRKTTRYRNPSPSVPGVRQFSNADY